MVPFGTFLVAASFAYGNNHLKQKTKQKNSYNFFLKKKQLGPLLQEFWDSIFLIFFATPFHVGDMIQIGNE